jgi:hypothetical protein
VSDVASEAQSTGQPTNRCRLTTLRTLTVRQPVCSKVMLWTHYYPRAHLVDTINGGFRLRGHFLSSDFMGRSITLGPKTEPMCGVTKVFVGTFVGIFS